MLLEFILFNYNKNLYYYINNYNILYFYYKIFILNIFIKNF